MKTTLKLNTGHEFVGKTFGKETHEDIFGEVVFQTGMVGYPESLTDPSYLNQILVLTYPLVGNYGISEPSYDTHGLDKIFESNNIHIKALVVGEYNPKYSHWRGKKSLGEWLEEHNIIGISGVDTRELVKIIRENQNVVGHITNNMNNKDNSFISIDDLCEKTQAEYVSMKLDLFGNKILSDKIIINENPDLLNILVIDCGIKNSQLRALLKYNVQLTIVGTNYNFTPEILTKTKTKIYDGIFLSNGPGNPHSSNFVVEQLKAIIDSNLDITIFGICYGHQLIGLASGCKIGKMKYGNRGHNIPCNLVGTKKCYITSQNHGYEVLVNHDAKQSQWAPLFVNSNDGSNEGLIHKEKPIFSVQFHPEARAGPTDSVFLFKLFIERCKSNFNVSKRIYQIVNQSLSTCVSYVNNVKHKIKKILILGSGGLSIGQAGEFDYSGSQAIKAFKEENIEVILVNPNIATIQTSKGLADKIYYLPVTPEYVKQVIDKEQPDGISLSFGGQTALNCGVKLYEQGYLENIKILGSSLESVMDSEDRERFKNILEEIGEYTAPSKVVSNIQEAKEFSKHIGYPLLIRSSFALGGLGSGFANNENEMIDILSVAFNNNSHVIIDKSLKGWKELEYEIVRDSYDNCISVCNMENIDPLGIHTGESIVVAPSQTLSDKEYNCLRSVAFKVIRRLGIIGECNIQYALDPESSKYYIIEVNPRLSRSSALASKATGYPLAYIAAKLSLGYSLLEINNSITRLTACYEPSLDYCVVKIPRWDLRKFPMVNDKLGSSMKSVGEVMSISRSFEEAFQKALRMANENILGFYGTDKNWRSSEDELINPNNNRINSIANSFYSEQYDVDTMYNLTKIDKWYLKKMWKIIEMQKTLENINEDISKQLLYRAKRIGFSDYQISRMIKKTEIYVRDLRESHNIKPVVKQLDTVAAEYPCYTNYLYLTYNGDYNDISFDDETIIVLGSGVYRIGSSVEFDWCAVNCVRELRERGYKTVMVNYNPETVSTDYDEVDRLYFDEISFESVMDIYGYENCKGVILSMGGQIANNIAMSLHRKQVKIIGTNPENIDNAENRFKFSRMLDQINIDQPQWRELTNASSAREFCNEVGYPCVVRPSYVLSGAMMCVIYSQDEMDSYLQNVIISNDYPVVISKFIIDAKEIEVDAVADKGILKLWAISEHVEDAGVHSGDATLILPPKNINETTKTRLLHNTQKIAKKLEIDGPFNIQYIAKNNELKVIECNLRVSRSFPFVSKVKDINFIRIATKIMLGSEYNIDTQQCEKYTGVKVPQFSFNRLANADNRLGVEMLSTGEVACFGESYQQAYLKALCASGFKVKNKCNVLLSIGSNDDKNELCDSIKMLFNNGFIIYGTSGTSKYYTQKHITIHELNNEKIIYDKIKEGFFGLVINISNPNKIKSQHKTHGYYIRRLSIDYGVDVLINIKCAKLYIESIVSYFSSSKIIDDCDVKTTNRYYKLPMLIDLGVHIRDTTGEQPESWDTSSQAALKAGIGLICAVPNTKSSSSHQQLYNVVDNLAKNNSLCDYMLFMEANGENYKDLEDIKTGVCGVKFYLNQNFSYNNLDNISVLRQYFIHCPDDLLMCFHAKVEMVGTVLYLNSIYNKRIHICDVSKKEEIEMIKDAKEHDYDVTCQVRTHNLFMDEILDNNLPDTFTNTPEDRHALWQHMDIIDCLTGYTVQNLKEEGKQRYDASLQNTLPLLLDAVNKGRLTMEDIENKYYHNPKKILGLHDNYGEDSYIEVNLDKEYTIKDEDLSSKSSGSAFNGIRVLGCIERFVYKNKCVYNNGVLETTFDQGINTIVYKKPSISSNIKNVNNNIIENIDEINSNTNNLCDTYKFKNVIDVSQFNRDNLRILYNNASVLKQNIKKQGKLDILNGKTIGLYFDEPSSRTYGSFHVAIQKLGCDVLSLNDSISSSKKGESLYDTLKCIESYCDMIVIRTKHKNILNKIQNLIKIPIINAGDGDGQHPTQALLDVFTIREERGTVNKLVVSIVGDLRYGRTVHSLVRLLSNYDIKFNFVSIEQLSIDKDTINFLNKKNINYETYDSINDIIETTDVLYMTRIQKERFQQQPELNTIDFDYIERNLYLTQEIMTNAKQNMVIMHPLPRNEEIHNNIDNDPRATYFRQMENGLYVRMALIQMML